MAKRRGHGEGSISQRADGRWCAIITVGYDQNGKRRRKTVYGKTKKEVTEQLTRLQSQKLDGLLTPTSRITVGEFLDRWVNDAAALSVRPSTLHSYKLNIEKHIKPRIGGVQLSKLTPLQVQSVYGQMSAAGLSPRMQEYVHSILHRAFVVGIKWGLLVRNVCQSVERPSVPRREMKVLKPEQAAKFLETARGDRLNALYVVAITTGLRQGELFGLEWSDIDLKAGTVQVQRTVVEIDGKFLTHEPKTDAGRRLVTLPRLAVDALQDHRRQSLAEGLAGNPRVFTQPDGSSITRDFIRRQSLHKLLAKAGLPMIRFHDLRHSAATLLLSEGIHPKVVQERLGHSSIQMTLDTYSHAVPSMQADAAARLDGLLNPPKPAAEVAAG